MLDVGFRSGCLTVISNDFEKNYQMFLESVFPFAKQEWNKFDEWTPALLFLQGNHGENFDICYKLNKEENIGDFCGSFQLFYTIKRIPFAAGRNR